MPLFMDLALARRLERTEGAVSTSFIPARQAIAPQVGATWQDFDGTYAIFDGETSPLTQTFGLGLFAPATPALMSDIERFFAARGAHAMHEVSPLAGVETLAALADRGYRPIEVSTVLTQAIDELPDGTTAPALRVRAIDPADRATWIATSVAAWTSEPSFMPIIQAMAEAASANAAMQHFLVEHDGAPIATASLGIHDGVALLAGASTIVSARGRGAQGLLLSARIAEARRRGCDLAMMVAAAGSTSQRNAERRGFRVAYTRTKWQLTLPANPQRSAT